MKINDLIDPIFYGKRWYIDCSEDTAFMVVTARHNSKDATIKKRAAGLLKKAGFGAKLREVSFGKTVFPDYGMKSSATVQLIDVKLDREITVTNPFEPRIMIPES